MQAIIVIDVQNDFCADGALAVPEADMIIADINQKLNHFNTVVFTQDWHPANHLSFASSHDAAAFSEIELGYGLQTLWPDHCIQNSSGAAFHPKLNLAAANVIIRKGSNPSIDSYSAFYENDRLTPTGLNGWLNERGVKQLSLVGLATDFCVAWTAIDARKLGFKVEVELGLCRAIDIDHSLHHALLAMREAGVIIHQP